MRVKIAALAEYAIVSVENKLSIVGIFDRLFAPETPCAHPQMVIVVQFEFEQSEAGHKHFQVELLDESEQTILSISGEGDIPASENAEPMTRNQVVTLRNVGFPHFGEYEFKVLLDGEAVATLPVNVVRASGPGQSGV